MLVRGKIFEKNNMVSNGSKLPNSARNAIKILFGGGGKWRWKAGAAVPAGLVIRRKIFEKNNMVSNDSKLPNSARNAIKNFFLVAAENGGGSGGPAAVFLKDTKTWGN